MKAVYIHLPFCRSICSYCDFCKVFYDEKWSHPYLIKLKEEIEDSYQNDEIKSIYIGGGTPSCLKIEELEYLFEIIKQFNTKPNFEFTFECNLGDLNEELLSLLKVNHVNRLSIGIQSFNAENLSFLGRKHTFREAEIKIKLARDFGFHNINLDLIYAIPNETIKTLKNDLTFFLKLKPEHLSTYSLMIEPHTILSSKKIQPIAEDLDEEMYQTICKTLKLKGYEQYEVSNFAKKGMTSIHNLTYWDNEEYYGFGLSAAGYIDKIRYTNTYCLTKYLDGLYHGTEEILSDQAIMDNEIMLGLRKIKGLNKKEFYEKYHLSLEDAYPIKPLIKNGELQEKKEYISIPWNKLYVMNEILLKMI